jgi:hypothetical protein
MRHDRFRTLMMITCLCTILTAGAGRAAAEEENQFKKDMKQAGRDMKSGIVEFGRGMRGVGKDVGHGAVNVGKEVGHTAKDAPKDVADKVKHGHDRKEEHGPRIPLADP